MNKVARPSPRRIACSECGRKTNHTVLHLESDDRWEQPYFRNHILGRCAGCGTFHYIVEEGDLDDRDPDTGEISVDRIGYPTLAEYKPADWSNRLPLKVRAVYQETVAAMNQNLPLLAGVGLRALIETICKDRKIKSAPLHVLIEGLHSQGVLAEAQAKILHGLRFLGNAAAHEAVAAKPGELRAGLAIAEAILSTIYVVPTLSKEVKTGRKRTRRPTPSQSRSKP